MARKWGLLSVFEIEDVAVADGDAEDIGGEVFQGRLTVADLDNVHGQSWRRTFDGTWLKRPTRPEQAKDIEAVRRINQQGFETATEARFVDLLRDRGKLVVSLLAEAGDDLLGHIAFTLVHFPSHPECRGVVLGPMVVLPAMQRQGIGSALVRAGLERCRDMGYESVVVVGHPKFYPRFGFVPADRFGLKCSWSVPENAFMALELLSGAHSNPT